MTREDQVSYAAAYGGFKYQANSWEYPRRVVCKVEKPTDQLIHMFTFIVTNMDASVEDLIRFYCKRGHMENFIKESKNGVLRPFFGKFPARRHCLAVQKQDIRLFRRN